MKRIAPVASDYNNPIVALRWGRQKYARLFWPCLVVDNNLSNRRVFWLGTDQHSNIDFERTKDFGVNFKDTYKKDAFTPKEEWALYQFACRQAVAIAHKFDGKGSSIIDWNNLGALDFSELPNIRTTYKDACSISATVNSPIVDEPVVERPALQRTKSRTVAKGKQKTFPCKKCPQEFQTFLALSLHLYAIHVKATEENGPSTNEAQNSVTSAEYGSTLDDHVDLPPGCKSFSLTAKQPRAKKSIIRVLSSVSTAQTTQGAPSENDDIQIVYVKKESIPAQVVQDAQVESSSASTSGAPMKCSLCPFSTQDAEDLKTHTLKHDRPFSMNQCRYCTYVANEEMDFYTHAKLHTFPDSAVRIENRAGGGNS